MSTDWEQTFRNWSKPSSDTEAGKAANAERMVRSAITNSEALSKHRINVFAQGSYKNNTNVKKDSDVDICVCCTELIYGDYSLAPNVNDSKAGLVPATYRYEHFKNDLEQALIKKFGKRGTTCGNKAFDVHANTYRIDADVVPTMVRRLYSKDGTYRQGTQVRTRDGTIINNWPNQNYDNGVSKNKNTGNRFKLIVRAIKRLRNHMSEKGYNAAKPIPSYLIECLVYVVPDQYFSGDSYKTNVENCIKYLYNEIDSTDWTEVNEIKYLFRSSQKWNKAQVKAFLEEAWDYIQNR